MLVGTVYKAQESSSTRPTGRKDLNDRPPWR